MSIKVENSIRDECTYQVQYSHRFPQQEFDWSNLDLVISLYQNLIQKSQALNSRECYCLLCRNEGSVYYNHDACR